MYDRRLVALWKLDETEGDKHGEDGNITDLISVMCSIYRNLPANYGEDAIIPDMNWFFVLFNLILTNLLRNRIKIACL